MAQRRNSRAGRRRGGVYLGALGLCRTARPDSRISPSPSASAALLGRHTRRRHGPVSAIAELPEEGLAVSYIDVGQGDATLIVCNGEAMLIDAGVPEAGQTVVDYLHGLRRGQPGVRRRHPRARRPLRRHGRRGGGRAR